MTSSRCARAISAAAVGLAFLASCGTDERGDSTTETSRSETSASATGVPATEPGTTSPVTTIDAPDTTSGPPPTTTPAPPSPVFEFATAAAAEGWQVINDTVMGGGVRE